MGFSKILTFSLALTGCNLSVAKTIDIPEPAKVKQEIEKNPEKRETKIGAFHKTPDGNLSACITSVDLARTENHALALLCSETVNECATIAYRERSVNIYRTCLFNETAHNYITYYLPCERQGDVWDCRIEKFKEAFWPTPSCSELITPEVIKFEKCLTKIQNCFGSKGETILTDCGF